MAHGPDPCDGCGIWHTHVRLHINPDGTPVREEVSCPRCGCPVAVNYDTTVDHDIAVCPNCGLARCAGLDCWCLEVKP
jgi:hypothetical protein